MRVLDLFSGIGGFSLGLERAGFQPVAFCELLPKPRHTLATHWPGVPIYDDVRTLTAARLAADGIAPRAICGGFPCQDISFAGKGAGIDGERSGLWGEYARLIGEVRPELVFVENVSALLGRGLGRVLGDLASLGYHAWWDCIPASAVGAPHRRDRLWLVAYPGSLEHQGYGDALRRAIAAELAAADAYGECGRTGEGQGQRRGVQHGTEALDLCLDVADPARVQPGRPIERPKRQRVGKGREPIALGHPDDVRKLQPEGRERAEWGRSGHPGWWLSEPDVGRVAHGVPARVDRLHGLGNAVVPEIPYRLGKAALSALQAVQAEAAA